jgi:hypothetical protein
MSLCLDRRVTLTGTFDGSGTTWTLPYSVPTNGSAGTVAVVSPAGEQLTVTRPSATTVRATGNHPGACAVGLLYLFSARLSTIYAKDWQGQPDLRAPLTLRRVRVLCDSTRRLDATVVVPGRAPFTVSGVWTPDEPAQQLHVPIVSLSAHTFITLSSLAPFGTRVGSLEFDGQLTIISTRRI